MQINNLTKLILEKSFLIHTKLGPGLFESVYENCLKYELTKISVQVEQQKPIPLIYDGIKMDNGFRMDLLIENKVIVEIKSIESFTDLHYKQILTYLKLSNVKIGLLINFNVGSLKNGIKRFIN